LLASGFPADASLILVVNTGQPSLAAGDYAMHRTVIEGYRVARLQWGTAKAQPITLGFFCQHTVAGTYSVSLANSANDRSCTHTYTQNVANVPEWKAITFPGDTSGTWLKTNGVGLYVRFTYAAGTSLTTATTGSWVAGNYIAATGQVNAVATAGNIVRLFNVIVLPGIEAPSAERAPLIMRPYDQELVTCQRYFESWDNAGGGNYTTAAMGVASTSTIGYVHFPFKTRKRASPTFTSNGTSNFAFYRNGFNNAMPLTGLSANSVNADGAILVGTVSSGLASIEVLALVSNGGTQARLYFDARL
jgi:hypothetical protein